MNNQQYKLENPERLAELKPTETLKKIGLNEHDVLCDIGAGSGVFTIPAAKITDKSVLALDINDEVLYIIKEKAKKEKLPNIKTLKVTGDHYDIETDTVDFVILVSIFHGMPNKEALFAELKRIMKNTGKLAIIEFHKQQTLMGPPVSRRISKDEVTAMCSRHGFSRSNEFDLDDNYYCVVFNT